MDLVYESLHDRPVDKDFHCKKAIRNHNRKATLCTLT